MRHVDYGLSILSKQALLRIPANTAYDLADLYCELAECGELAAMTVSERFYEVGSAAGIEAAETYLTGRATQ
jgi:hypothetical protein